MSGLLAPVSPRLLTEQLVCHVRQRALGDLLGGIQRVAFAGGGAGEQLRVLVEVARFGALELAAGGFGQHASVETHHIVDGEAAGFAYRFAHLCLERVARRFIADAGLEYHHHALAIIEWLAGAERDDIAFADAVHPAGFPLQVLRIVVAAIDDDQLFAAAADVEVASYFVSEIARA